MDATQAQGFVRPERTFETYPYNQSMLQWMSEGMHVQVAYN